MSSSTDAIFPDGLPDSLYDVLSVSNTASVSQIRTSYRLLALCHHPDKHATASEEERNEHALKFQQVGFAYAVLSDEKRRAKYDRTGSVEESMSGLDMGDEEGGWEAYFEMLFEQVSRDRLDEDKKAYQGSEDELNDLKSAYVTHEGSLPDILNSIPHSNYTDEQRLVARLKPLIESSELPHFPAWEKTVSDQKGRKERVKEGKREEKEAEEMAKELGVWDEFYGTGKKGARKGKGKKANQENETEDGDTGALQALILARQKKSAAGTSSFLDNLAAKYSEPEPKARKGKGKKRAMEEADVDDMEESPQKKSKSGHEELDELDEEAFRKLQEGMFGKKSSGITGEGGKRAGAVKAGKGKKNKK